MWFVKTKKYSVIVEGANIYINSDGIVRRAGLYATRWVKADSEKEAGEIACELVRSELNALGFLKNDQDNLPIFRADEIVEVETFRGHGVPGKGYSLFYDDGVNDS